MAAFVRYRKILTKLKPFCQQRRLFTNTRVLLAGNWDENWEMGKYPETEEERIAAAKKYGLHPSEYKPFPDDGMGCGDYPDLPEEGWNEKSHFQNWDNLAMRRNYGDPMPHSADMLIPGKWEPNINLPHSWTYYVTMCLGAFLAFVGAMAWTDKYLTINGAHESMPKQYPWNDHWVEKGGDPDKMPVVKHYTFEPAE